jgi:hypothetical protein
LKFTEKAGKGILQQIAIQLSIGQLFGGSWNAAMAGSEKQFTEISMEFSLHFSASSCTPIVFEYDCTKVAIRKHVLRASIFCN